jgi:predicted nuclease of predicted toxin-antitoxin system
LLDDMFDARIAVQLAERGIDAVAVVADPSLRESPDSDLLDRALADGRALVTNDVRDFERLRLARTADTAPVPTLIYTSDRSFPRDRDFIGRLVSALAAAAAAEAVTAAGSVLWLSPVDKESFES